MAKLKNPFFSLGARGKLGKWLRVVPRHGQDIAQAKAEPPDVKSLAQLSWRHMYQKGVALWHALSAAEKEEWESQARPKHMTGFAWFMSQCLKPNPGLYLPLQGGTMAGNIDMATNRILGLPDPTVNQEPDTLAARIAAILAHKGVAAAHHAVFTSALHTAIGNNAPHHVRYTDGEAVDAMGGKADGNPLHHDRAAEWGAAEHTAIGNAAPHHAQAHSIASHNDTTATGAELETLTDGSETALHSHAPVSAGLASGLLFPVLSEEVPSTVDLNNPARIAAHSILHPEAIKITHVGFLLNVITDNPGTLYCEIWDDAGDFPNAVIANGSDSRAQGEFIEGAFNWFKFDTPPSLTANTKYWVIFKAPNIVLGSYNYYYWDGIPPRGNGVWGAGTRGILYYSGEWHEDYCPITIIRGGKV